MPVYLDRVPSSDLLKERVRYGKQSNDVPQSGVNEIDIGIINNMAERAIKSTERQFLQLLDSAAGGLTVNVTFYGLSDVPRSRRARSHIDSFYARVEDLWDRRLDGLIMTGAEPRTANLRDEPYWSSLTGVLEWADQNTSSSIWSCLAAHAAVLHLDGIQRRRLAEKCFGLFPSVQMADHFLTVSLPSRVVVPHSRWNDLPENELADCGYELLSGSQDTGIDIFVRQRNSLFVFFQGHPEYEADTLLLEYRRDVGRYLRGEQETYPSMPQNCLSADVVSVLAALQKEAMRERREQLLNDFPTAMVEQSLKDKWSSAASCIYRNWLNYLFAVKQHRLRAESAPAKSSAQAHRLVAGAS